MDGCEKIEQMLEAYADGELTVEQKELVEQHVAHCPHCAALLDEYLALNEAIANCTVQAPEGFAERVAAAVEQEQKAAIMQKSRGVRLGRIAPFIGVGLAAVICISVVSSSLVKYIIKNLADSDLSEEVSTEELNQESPGRPMPDEGIGQGSYEETVAAPESDWEQAPEQSPTEAPTMDQPSLEEPQTEAVYDSITQPEGDESETTEPETTEPETTETTEMLTEAPTDADGGDA